MLAVLMILQEVAEPVRELTDQEKAAAAGVGILGILGFLCVGLFGLLFYCIPAAIAVLRGHQNTIAIAALNILLGWSFLGWVAALVWSLTEVRRS